MTSLISLALMLPEVRDSAASFGMTRSDLFGAEIPILGVAGDQQAATVGQDLSSRVLILACSSRPMERGALPC